MHRKGHFRRRNYKLLNAEGKMKLSRFFGLLVVILGCAIGKEPPEETPMVEIKEGLKFLFGSTKMCFNENYQGEKTCKDPNIPKVYPTMKVELKPFAIDVHEVTNIQFRYCFEIGKCTTEPQATFISTTKGNIDYYGNSTYDNYPVVNITWEMADEYCKAFGKRLPTEFEWERVAGGSSMTEDKKRVFPFENIKEIKDCKNKNIAIQYCNPLIESPSEVGTSLDDFVIEGGEKIYDLGGNVNEWVMDYYKEGITCKSELPEECDCWKCKSQECKENCYNCPPCKENLDCFKQCDPFDAIQREGEESVPGYPVCISFGNEIVEGTTLTPKGGDYKIVKGGNYRDTLNNTCKIQTSYRDTRLTPKSFSATLGFRCVKDL